MNDKVNKKNKPTTMKNYFNTNSQANTLPLLILFGWTNKMRLSQK